MKTINDRNIFYPQDAVHLPGFIATMMLPLRRSVHRSLRLSAITSSRYLSGSLSRGRTLVRAVRCTAGLILLSFSCWRRTVQHCKSKLQILHISFNSLLSISQTLRLLSKNFYYRSLRPALRVAGKLSLCAFAQPLRLCVKPSVFLCVLVSPWFNSLNAQQNTESQYRKPLKEVLNDIQTRYGVQIKYDEKLIADKFVNYADWRYRTGVEETLDNILSLFDMVAKKEKDKVYKLSNYEYYRWLPADGWAELDRIASQYKNVEEWEKRKAGLKECLLETIQLSHLPKSPGTAPIRANFRKMNGYTIENLAIEILPGVWVNGSLYNLQIIKEKSLLYCIRRDIGTNIVIVPIANIPPRPLRRWER